MFSYFLTGLAMATQLALNCVFVARLANAPLLMGVFQGCYGIGGVPNGSILY